jgi:hypothetical protein
MNLFNRKLVFSYANVHLVFNNVLIDRSTTTDRRGSICGLFPVSNGTTYKVGYWEESLVRWISRFYVYLCDLRTIWESGIIMYINSLLCILCLVFQAGISLSEVSLFLCSASKFSCHDIYIENVLLQSAYRIDFQELFNTFWTPIFPIVRHVEILFWHCQIYDTPFIKRPSLLW